jgi:hypothetical protein
MAVKFKKGIDLQNQKGINAADPTAGTDVANKQYVDAVARGLDWKYEVVAASTANVTLASPGTTLDGVTLSTGMQTIPGIGNVTRVLLKDQTTASENGVYDWNGGAAALTRSVDSDSGQELSGSTYSVQKGTVNADRVYRVTTDDTITLGTTPVAFAQVGAGTSYTADGNALKLAGTVFSVSLDGTTLSQSASGLRIGSGAAGAGLVEATGVLAVGAGTGITVAADTVGVDTSVVTRKFAADCVATTNPQTFTHGLGTDIEVQIWEGTELVYTDVTKSATSGGQVTVDWGSAPTAAQYRVVVQG